MRINRGLIGRGVTHLIGRDFVISETNCCVNNVRRPNRSLPVCFVFTSREKKRWKKRMRNELEIETRRVGG